PDAATREARRARVELLRAFLDPTAGASPFRQAPGESMRPDFAEPPVDHAAAFETALRDLEAATVQHRWSEESPRAFLVLTSAFRADDAIVRRAVEAVRQGRLP